MTSKTRGRIRECGHGKVWLGKARPCRLDTGIRPRIGQLWQGRFGIVRLAKGQNRTNLRVGNDARRAFLLLKEGYAKCLLHGLYAHSGSPAWAISEEVYDMMRLAGGELIPEPEPNHTAELPELFATRRGPNRRARRAVRRQLVFLNC